MARIVEKRDGVHYISGSIVCDAREVYICPVPRASLIDGKWV